MEGLRIGFHVSISGGLHKSAERALERGCTAFQIFCGNPRGWAMKKRSGAETEKFKRMLDDYDIIPPFVHACYLLNPCSSEAELKKRTRKRFTAELIETSRFGARYYVIHPGSAKGAEVEQGILQAAKAITTAAVRAGDKTGNVPVILLENTAGDYGPGANLKNLDQLRTEIINMNKSINVGFAIDTCHAHSAGYDLNREDTLKKLESDLNLYLGVRNIHLIHANDSATPAGSGTDRHQHIGKGSIGHGGFHNFFSLSGINTQPVILETPGESAQVDITNLNTIISVIKRTRGLAENAAGENSI